MSWNLRQVLLGDTVIDSFSLPTSSTTYMSELRIPAGNTLTTTNTSTGYLKMTIEGTPEAGHVFIHAADSASSKMDVKPVTLPEGMELVCVNTQDGVREYVLKNTNEWTEELKEASWIEHEMPKDALKAEAKYGEVTYQFSGEIDGTYQNGLPEKEGTTATTEKPQKPSENTTVVPTQAVTDNKSLRLVGAAGRTSIKLKWTKNKSADGYQIYGSTCGKNKYRLLKTVTKNSVITWTKTKLKKATSYRFYIRAYKMSNEKNRC